MKYASSLTQAVLLKRYKRFLAEVVLNNQEQRTIYCPNMGSMMGCDVLGSRIWFSASPNGRRKFSDTWELVEVNGGHLVCVNVLHTYKLIIEAIENGTIAQLQGYTRITEDLPELADSGLDLMLEKSNNPPGEENLLLLPHEKCFIVAKGVTLGDEVHRGFFPDSVNERNLQQLRSLIHAKQLGYRAVLFYCVMHTGIERVFPADHIDSEYGQLLRQAVLNGVELLAYRVNITMSEITLVKELEVCVPARLICNSRPEKSK
ncbi:MAG: DNA/RNA nuclease SfsA [Candidatus Berkiellales bacterium]